MKNSYKVLLLFCFFVALRLALLNLNAAEWGDSYHILRGALALINFSYPLDEKRLPGFSALIAPFLFLAEPVSAGRIVVALLTLAILILSYKLDQLLFPERRDHLWVPIFLALTPVFLYWSIRVMAIVPFTALVLAVFYIFYRCVNGTGLVRKRTLLYILLGVLVGLACLVRYDGFLLLPGFFAFFFLRRKWRDIFTVFGPWAVVTLPWYIWSRFIAAGQTSSAYFAEARTFSLLDLGRLRFFALSVLFLFVFPPFMAFIWEGVRSFVRRNREDLICFLPLGGFILLEILLAFFWTPSVPRILIPTMPFLIIFFLEGVERPSGLAPRRSEFAPELRRIPSQVWGGWKLLLISFGLFVLYIAGQYFERAYFLVLSRGGMVLVLAFSFLSVIALVSNFNNWSKRLFYTFFLLALSVSSFVVLGNQRKIYLTVYRLSQDASHLPGKVAYFDETGVSWWYLNQLSGNGVYYPQDATLSSEGQWQWLRRNDVRYILWTNEFNRGSVLSIVNDADYHDRFRLLRRVEVEISDGIDRFLIRRGLLPEREYPVLSSALYEVKIH